MRRDVRSRGGKLVRGSEWRSNQCGSTICGRTGCRQSTSDAAPFEWYPLLANRRAVQCSLEVRRITKGANQCLISPFLFKRFRPRRLSGMRQNLPLSPKSARSSSSRISTSTPSIHHSARSPSNPSTRPIPLTRNKQFWDATPNGELKMTINNPSAAEFFRAREGVLPRFQRGPADTAERLLYAFAKVTYLCTTIR